jgi:hypothetical protein
MVFGNMTRAELVREAEHTFPNPSPIIAAMIAHLAHGRHEDGLALPTDVQGSCQCPTCGGHLKVEFK